MTLASSSRAQLYYMKETTPGTTPVAGNGRSLRMTGESLAYSLTKDESKEIRSDRQIAGAVTVDAQSSGGFNFHNQYAEYDQLVEGALQSVYGVYGTSGVGTSFTSATTATTITASVAPTGANAFTTLALGQWFRYNDPALGVNNGAIVRASPSVAPTATVITLDASTPLAVEAGVASVTISTSRLSNGVTQASFSLEKGFLDITQYLVYKGMQVNKLTENFTAGGLTDGSFDFIGMGHARNTATVMPGTVSASNTYDIQNGVSGIGSLWDGTAPITGTYIKSITINVENNLRGQKALGNLGNVGIGTGDFKTSGTMSVYFANGTDYDKFLNDTYTQIIVATKDASKNGYAYTMPRVLLMNAKVAAGGKNQDVMIDFDYMAFSDDANAVVALRKTLFIDRYGAAVP